MRIIGALIVLALCPFLWAADATPVSDPLGRNTPRDAVVGYLDAVDKGKFGVAAEYLDLRNLPPPVAQYKSDQLANGLAIVLQRALWIDLEKLSDSPEGYSADGLPSFRDELGVVPTRDGQLQLLLQRVPGDSEGSLVWKISNATLSKLPELYELYRYHPFVEYLYRHMPKVSILGLELFKWAAALTAMLAAAPFVLLLLWWLSRVLVKPDRPLHGRVRRYLLGPVAVAVLLLVLDAVILDLGLGLAAQKVTNAQTLLILVSLWLIWDGLNLARDAYLQHLVGIGREGSVSLIRPLASALKVIFLMIGVLMWLDNLGYEITALLTGLGIGGIAVALVLQKPLEDVFGAITLYTQQPIRIGDFGKFGTTSGTIEEIGLRTTRIRTLENSVVAIPNMRLAGEPIENLSVRNKILFQPVLRLRTDTPLEKVNQVLQEIRAMLADHPRILEEGARVRFQSIGADALQIQVFAYVNEKAFPAYLEIAEALNFRILEILSAAGVQLAFVMEALLSSRKESPV